ncbi:ankyrin repeat domain-containing protein [Parachlamydia sp. AcF125]|uniref:ankyrin repeat domain-containing protein n=1 Tax=Parachlamydia sp. AcF125 TaxID=2795736 RepID=UPI001BCA30F1|nr:ankyrin repeat domain-containing protein [Parachlamydia sp. AcF125]MBS4168731.1 hypothetical protein [Parachlamydia sp. AcF125]
MAKHFDFPEGATPIDDCSGLIPSWVHNLNDLNRIESVKASLDEIVKILIAAGAEVDTKDRSGLTPFQVAVLQGNKLLADFLLSQGARQCPPPGSVFAKYCRLYPD